MSRYVNQVRISSGRRIEVQAPIDDRFTFYNSADVLADILNDQPVRWFEGMQIQVITGADSYLWLAVDNVPPNVMLLDSSLYTYAIDYPDPLYAGREFGFFKLAKMVSKHSELLLDDGRNPHGTTKVDVGLNNVNNTSDANKPVSIAQQAAINTREPNLGNPSGNGYVLYSTVAGVRYWGAPQVGISDAPNNSKPYVRKDSAWTEGIVKQDFDTLGQSVGDLQQNVNALDQNVTTLQQDVNALAQATADIDEFVEYDTQTDTYKLTPTQDGQVQNLGQEVFFKGVNIGATGALATAPKLFIGGSDAGGGFFNMLQVSAAGLSQNALYGLNTTDVAIAGNGKITTYGEMRGVDTSAWAVNTRLYADTIAGNLTPVKPFSNIFYVATVKFQDAVDGILFVNTIQAGREDLVVTPVSSLRGYFSGNDALAPANAFYITSPDAAAGAEVTQVIAAPQNGTAWIGKGTVGANISGITVNVGQVSGQIEFQTNSTNGAEQLLMEVYLADESGTALNSGNGLPNGSLGVSPIVILKSPIMTGASGVTRFAEISGYIYTELILAPTQRLRFRIGASKVGGNNSVKNVTIYQGANHETYAEQAISIQAEDVEYDNIASGLGAVTVQQALDELAIIVRTASIDAADDAAAAVAGVPIGGLYNTTGTVKIRLV